MVSRKYVLVIVIVVIIVAVLLVSLSYVYVCGVRGHQSYGMFSVDESTTTCTTSDGTSMISFVLKNEYIGPPEVSDCFGLQIPIYPPDHQIKSILKPEYFLVKQVSIQDDESSFTIPDESIPTLASLETAIVNIVCENCSSKEVQVRLATGPTSKTFTLQCPSGSSVVLQGTVWQQSDTQDPDSRANSGIVFAATRDQLRALSERESVSEDDSLQFFSFLATLDSLNEIATAVSSIQSDGTYRLDLEPGNYAICFAVEPVGDATLAQVPGCLDIRRYGETGEVIDINFGEGGVTQRR